jgi:hypothetical protein
VDVRKRGRKDAGLQRRGANSNPAQSRPRINKHGGVALSITNQTTYVCDLSCRLRCSDRLNALLQNWHLYFFSGTLAALRVEAGVELATSVMSAEGM